MRDKKGRFIKGHKVNTGKRNTLGKHWKCSLSEAQREKKRLLLKGKPSLTFGKKWSSEARKNFSKKCQGKNANNWKGGLKPINKVIRAGIEFRLWREAVFARDNWTCQKYKVRGGKLVPHHIKNFSEYKDLRFAIDNGITLSERAHREFHKKYGFTKNTREQLEEFLGKI